MMGPDDLVVAIAILAMALLAAIVADVLVGSEMGGRDDG